MSKTIKLVNLFDLSCDRCGRVVRFVDGGQDNEFLHGTRDQLSGFTEVGPWVVCSLDCAEAMAHLAYTNAPKERRFA